MKKIIRINNSLTVEQTPQTRTSIVGFFNLLYPTQKNKHHVTMVTLTVRSSTRVCWLGSFVHREQYRPTESLIGSIPRCPLWQIWSRKPGPQPSCILVFRFRTTFVERRKKDQPSVRPTFDLEFVNGLSLFIPLFFCRVPKEDRNYLYRTENTKFRTEDFTDRNSLFRVSR